MSNLHVKKGDTVVLLTGKYNDKKTKDGAMKTGKVVEVSPKEGKVIVEGINMVTKHMKPNRMGQKGAIVNAEAPIYACKVQVVCPKCGKPTRVGYQVKENGAKDRVRVCKKCGETF